MHELYIVFNYTYVVNGLWRRAAITDHEVFFFKNKTKVLIGNKTRGFRRKGEADRRRG
jgi:hypothetical protein